MILVLNILLLACIITAFLISQWKRGYWGVLVSQLYLRTNQKSPSLLATTHQVDTALKALNVHAKISKDEDKRVFEFTYQKGNFLIDFSESSLEVLRILYPGISTLPLAYLDQVRTLCNQINQMDGPINAFYTVIEHQQVATHLKCHIKNERCTELLEGTLQKVFDETFYMHRFASQILDELKNENDAQQANDFEYAYHQNKSLESTLLEGQMLHDIPKDSDTKEQEWRTLKKLSIGEWLEATGLLKARKLCRMEILQNGQQMLLNDDQSIRNHLLLQAPEEGVTAPTSAIGITTIHVTYEPLYTLENDGSAPLHVLTLTLLKERTTPDAFFYRLNYQLPQTDALQVKDISPLDAQSAPTCGSMILGINRKSDQQARTEFQFIWDDARDKVKEHREADLSETQRQLLSFSNPDLGFYLYWGNRYMAEKRPLEAYIMLQKVWACLNDLYPSKLDKRSKQLFYDINFWMGRCLCQVGLFEKAFYYLNFCELKPQPSYSMLTIKCLMAAHDGRAYGYVKQRLEEVANFMAQYEESLEEIPAKLVTFQLFLRKSEVMLLIEEGSLKEAEQKCHAMLQDDSLLEFALRHLLKIHRMQQEYSGETDSHETLVQESSQGKSTGNSDSKA